MSAGAQEIPAGSGRGKAEMGSGRGLKEGFLRDKVRRVRLILNKNSPKHLSIIFVNYQTISTKSDSKA